MDMNITYKQIFWVLCILLMIGQAGCKNSKKAQAKKAKVRTSTEMVPPVEETVATLNGYTRSQIYFKLQIGSYTTPLSEKDAFFNNVAGEEVKIDISPTGLYRYSVGKFNDYEQATYAESDLKERGYKDTFIVAYGNDDRRIELHMSEIWDFLYK